MQRHSCLKRKITARREFVQELENQNLQRQWKQAWYKIDLLVWNHTQKNLIRQQTKTDSKSEDNLVIVDIRGKLNIIIFTPTQNNLVSFIFFLTSSSSSLSPHFPFSKWHSILDGFYAHQPYRVACTRSAVESIRANFLLCKVVQQIKKNIFCVVCDSYDGGVVDDNLGIQKPRYCSFRIMENTTILVFYKNWK